MESASLAAVLTQPPHLSIALPGHIGRGRFSTGIEQHPDTPVKMRVGRFSDGIERLPDAAGTLRLGSFADGYERVA